MHSPHSKWLVWFVIIITRLLYQITSCVILHNSSSYVQASANSAAGDSNFSGPEVPNISGQSDLSSCIILTIQKWPYLEYVATDSHGSNDSIGLDLVPLVLLRSVNRSFFLSNPCDLMMWELTTKGGLSAFPSTTI